MRDINDYTHMTRECFLELIDTGNLDGECPSVFKLLDCKSCPIEKPCTDKFCKECWKQAVKDIKFKGDKKENNMEKKDLKNGMVVELRNGTTKYLVVDDEFVAYDGWMPTDAYNEDLTAASGDRFFDIIKIYETKGHSFRSKIEENRLTLIWQRSEVDWSKVAVDTKIEVSLGGKKWVKRHFKSYESTLVYAWCDGCTSFTGTKYIGFNHYRLYKEN